MGEEGSDMRKTRLSSQRGFFGRSIQGNPIIRSAEVGRDDEIPIHPKAFDVDDDRGYASQPCTRHLVDVCGRSMTPVGAIPLMRGWCEKESGGCWGKLHTHSVPAGLTGKHRVGEVFWVFVPGQKKGE